MVADITIKFGAIRSGIYILKLKGKIVYIGQSGNPFFRLVSHSNKRFDEIEIIWIKKKELRRVENELIKRHKPIYNRTRQHGCENNKNDSGFVYVNLKLSDKKHAFVKSEAAKKGISIQQYIVDLIDDDLKPK